MAPEVLLGKEPDGRADIPPTRCKFLHRVPNAKHRAECHLTEPDQNRGSTNSEHDADRNTDAISKLIEPFGFPQRIVGLLDIDVDESFERSERRSEIAPRRFFACP